jgi:site-specific recombinase XerD
MQKQALSAEDTWSDWIDDFLADMQNANRSHHTCRAYKTDLTCFARFNANPHTAFTIDGIRDYLSEAAHLKPTTRARKQAAY